MGNFTWLGISAIDWIGYAAFGIFLFTLSIASIMKNRIFTLLVSVIFTFYGFYIGALPVGLLGLAICIYNIYYLWKFLTKKDVLDTIEAKQDDEYLIKFLNHYKKEIEKFFPDFNIKDIRKKHIILAVRDMSIAGVFICTLPINGSSEILLDFVTPRYRDYVIGKYLFHRFRNNYLDDETKLLTCKSSVPAHVKYLKKIGFQAIGDDNSYFLALK